MEERRSKKMVGLGRVGGFTDVVTMMGLDVSVKRFSQEKTEF